MTGHPLAGTFVVVSGPPGSGKTTLARALAPAVGLPLIAKDTIKETLLTVLPAGDVAASRVLGRARAAGHFDSQRTPAELWNDEVARPVAGGWPVLTADTGQPVDIAALAGQVRAAAARARQQ